MDYFGKAKLGKELYANAQDYEELEIAKMTNSIDSYVDGHRDTITIDRQELNQLIDQRVQAQLANYSPVTNYSAEQQAIGTWMGNKTLYQKTFTGEVKSTDYNKDNEATIGSLPSGATIVDMRGWAYWNNGTTMLNSASGAMLGHKDSNWEMYLTAWEGNILFNCPQKIYFPYVITVQYTLD